MHDYSRYCSLSWSLPVFSQPSPCTEYELYLCIQLPKTKVIPMCPPYLPICGILQPLKVNFLCATFKPSKLLNLFCVPVLAHEEVLSALLFLHVCWLHTLTRMHNVLVPNIAEKSRQRVPSPQKISYNNHINLLTLQT